MYNRREEENAMPNFLQGFPNGNGFMGTVALNDPNPNATLQAQYVSLTAWLAKNINWKGVATFLTWQTVPYVWVTRGWHSGAWYPILGSTYCDLICDDGAGTRPREYHVFPNGAFK